MMKQTNKQNLVRLKIFLNGMFFHFVLPFKLSPVCRQNRSWSHILRICLLTLSSNRKDGILMSDIQSKMIRHSKKHGNTTHHEENNQQKYYTGDTISRVGHKTVFISICYIFKKVQWNMRVLKHGKCVKSPNWISSEEIMYKKLTD